jgi:hypothetical protein
VDIVDPQEDGEEGERPLLKWLLGAPQKVVKFLTEALVACVSHALSFVKFFWPEARLEAFAQGVAAEYSKEQFNEYLQEAQPVAEQIVKSILQDWDVKTSTRFLYIFYLMSLLICALTELSSRFKG